VVAGIFSAGALWCVPQNLHAHHPARDLIDDGVTVTADHVRVHVEEYRRGSSVDVVHATYTVAGEQITTRLARVPTEDVVLERGWCPAPGGSLDAPPLETVVTPDDPTLARAAVDAKA